MNKYIVGVDAGTTGTTVMIIDLQGNVIGAGYREYPCKFPYLGWVEQDINVIWEGICEASKEVIRRTGINPKEIGSLGLSSQRGTFMAIDRNWKCLHDSIVWSDGRASEEVEWIRNNLGSDFFQKISGLNLSVLWSYPKFKWIRDKRPDIYEKSWKFVNGQEWILHKFGSEEIFTDPSSITLNGMMDISKLDWSDELIKAINIDREKLPPIKIPMRQVGVISDKASKETGFASGMPICVGGGDQQCAAVGAGVIKEGLSEITIGTGSVIVTPIDTYKSNPSHSIIFGGHAIPNKWDMEGIAMSTGSCLRWWRDVFGLQEKITANELKLDVYALIDLEAAQAPVGCKGYIFFPFFAGQSAPYYHDNARGGSIGLSYIHNRAMMARAIMEGVSFELRMIVEAMEKVLTKPLNSIRLSGGGAKSDLWCQIQADIYGRPVEKLRVSECTTLGAAILGAVGAGIFNNIEEAVDNIVHPYKLIEPNIKNNEIYNDLFGIFKDTFLALRNANIYNKLKKISDKYWGE